MSHESTGQFATGGNLFSRVHPGPSHKLHRNDGLFILPSGNEQTTVTVSAGTNFAMQIKEVITCQNCAQCSTGNG